MNRRSFLLVLLALPIVPRIAVAQPCRATVISVTWGEVRNVNALRVTRRYVGPPKQLSIEFSFDEQGAREWLSMRDSFTESDLYQFIRMEGRMIEK